MYSYQHRYHAANMADIQKHTVLYAILEALREKTTPFGVIDAFAGEGVYDLAAPEAQKTGEYQEVAEIARSFPYYDQLVAVATSYQGLSLRQPYAGSPAIIRAALRAQDQAIFIENHPQAYQTLEETFRSDHRITLQKRDAYKALSVLLPLRQPRGLILIDPSYEVKDEYVWVPRMVEEALKKYRHGVFMIWYPLLKEGRHTPMVNDLQALGCPNIWKWEWQLKDPRSTERLYGSGLVVLNLPYGASKVLNPLQEEFSTGA